MPTLHTTLVAAAAPAAPALDPKRAVAKARERSSSRVPARKRFADADLDSAYAVLATRFPEETFSRGFVIGGAGPTQQVGLVAALVAAAILIVVGNFS